MLVHASCAALETEGAWQAVLLRGPSGSGKSSLLLRLVEAGWRLVSDDQTRLARQGARLIASAPPELAGLLEAHGLGLVRVPALDAAELRLVVDLVGPAEVERLPELRQCRLLDRSLPSLALAADDPAAVAKLRLALGRDRLLDPDQPLPEPWGAPTEAPPLAAGARPRRVVLVTGLSGAGRSLALNTLEDIGFEAIDNLPLELLDTVIERAGERPLALGVDIRTRHFAVEPFLAALERLKADPRTDATLLYIHCDDEVLRRRFTETRRRHPLAQDRPLGDGIVAERRLISPLRARADLVVDTSALLPADFRQILTGQLAVEGAKAMTLVVTSFSYRRGLPRTADLVFDVRFLRNPHYEPALRPLTGNDPAVAAFVEADPGFAPYYEALEAMLLPLLPRFEREGKSYLTIAFGCTGGRHRSVAVAGRLAARLESLGRRVTLVHRDLAVGVDGSPDPTPGDRSGTGPDQG